MEGHTEHRVGGGAHLGAERRAQEVVMQKMTQNISERLPRLHEHGRHIVRGLGEPGKVTRAAYSHAADVQHRK
jgi:hypothetical protein